MLDNSASIHTEAKSPQGENSGTLPQFLLENFGHIHIETIPKTASCEIVESADEDGLVDDIVYTQNGNRLSVRERFPGNYSLRVTQTTREEIGNNQIYNHYMPGRNEIELTRIQGEEDEFNITLLHELGHMEDESTDRKKKANSRETQSLVRSNVLETLGEDPLPPEAIETKFLEEAQRNVLLPSDRPALLESILKEYPYLSGLELNERKEFVRKMRVDHMSLRDQTILEYEQIAWNAALKSLYQFRTEGINLFGGTQAELGDYISGLYSTYVKDGQKNIALVESLRFKDERTSSRDNESKLRHIRKMISGIGRGKKR